VIDGGKNIHALPRFCFGGQVAGGQVAGGKSDGDVSMADKVYRL